MPRHVVVNPGTSVGLAELAERENADVIVFGSEYRTAPGTVKPGIPAHKLLLGGPAAIAVAPAGLRDNPSVSINTIGVIDEGDPAARQTAESLAAALGANVAERAGAGHIDLLVVGSRPESPAGKVTLSAASDYAVETAGFPVLVVPRGPVDSSFGTAGSAGLSRGRLFLTTRITAAIAGSRPSIRCRASVQAIGVAVDPRAACRRGLGLLGLDDEGVRAVGARGRRPARAR